MGRLVMGCEETLRFARGGLHHRAFADLRLFFSSSATHVEPMSLNRCEQRVFDYLQRHPDERQYWQGKFQRLTKAAANEQIGIEQVEADLWRYYVERSAVVPLFKEAAATEGLARTSMRNLAELLVRLWLEPRPQKKTAQTE